MIHFGDGVLPEEFFPRNFRTEVARARSHVSVSELEPCTGKGIGEYSRILVEAPRDPFVDRIESQRKVGGQHGRRVTLGGVVSIRHRARACVTFWLPLVRASRALGQFPLVFEQVLEEVVTPFCRRAGPGNFQAAGNGVARNARGVSACPAEALLFNRRAFGLSSHVWLGRGGSVRLAKSVAACDQGDRFFIV